MTQFLSREIINQCPDCLAEVLPNQRQELKAITVDGVQLWGRLCGDCIPKYRLPVSSSTGHANPYDPKIHGATK